MTQKIINIAIKDVRILFENSLRGDSLNVVFDWDVSDKTISEIGGRLIEDYVITKLPQNMGLWDKEQTGKFTGCRIPPSQRAIEDISFKWELNNQEIELELLVDVKGHNETKSGSRPNLASIRKCIELYSDESKEHIEIVIFFCRYMPEIYRAKNRTELKYVIMEESFSEKGIFLIRSLSDNNLDPADIGSGGQILFARENDINLVERSRKEFVDYLYSLSAHIDKLKELKAKK